MEKQQASSDHFHTNPIITHGDSDPPEPVRTRWTPKPEQILILESIFNSGMVNPPKEETVRIRKLLEKFGAVRDANVFYWFQNRRSRSRRRQRQQQQAAAAASGCNSVFLANSSSSCSSSGSSSNRSPNSYCSNYGSGGVAAVGGGGGVTNNINSVGGVSCSSSSSSGVISCLNPSGILRDDHGAGDDLFAISRQFGLLGSDQHNSNSACSSNLPQMHYQPSGTMTVFINGMAVELPRAPIDVRSMFGYDAMLVHSSGELLPVNEHGFLMKSLQMGESYFLVSRSV